jgi:hypothetical protein
VSVPGEAPFLRATIGARAQDASQQAMRGSVGVSILPELESVQLFSLGTVESRAQFSQASVPVPGKREAPNLDISLSFLSACIVVA